MPHRPPLPTDAELAILHVLWRAGPSTVRQVLDRLPSDRPVGYTTVLKLLQIMLEKGLVERDESARSHVYAAAVAEKGTEAELVSDLVEKGFSGSTGRLVLRALSSERATAEELKAIRDLLDRLEEEA